MGTTAVRGWWVIARRLAVIVGIGAMLATSLAAVGATSSAGHITPESGPTAGGTAVTITGQRFTGATGVSFGDTAATNVTVVSDTTITATTPAHGPGRAPVFVRFGNAGSSVAATGPILVGQFTFTGTATLAITRVAPSTGPTGGQQPFAVIGSGFAPGAAVTLDGVAATDVRLLTEGVLIGRTPAHAAGAVDVTVTNPDTQSATLAGGFTYVVVPDAPLTIRAIEPSSGPTGANETRQMMIVGTGFQQGAAVTFGGAPATAVTVLGGVAISANAPDHAPGAVDVVVTNPDAQSATKTNGYTYFTPIRVSGVSPTSGPVAGGTVVTLTGANFQPGATVAFGEDQATGVTVSADGTTITATTPAHRPGVATIIVTNPDHRRGTLPASFAFTGSDEGPPSATLALQRVAPPIGPDAGGMRIVVRGTGFTAGMTVTIGGAAATEVQVLNSMTITALTPAHAAGQVEVIVSHSDGDSATLANAYTYLTATNARHTWEDPTDPQGGAPANLPTSNRPGSGAGGAARTASTTGTTPGPAPAPPGR